MTTDYLPLILHFEVRNVGLNPLLFRKKVVVLVAQQNAISNLPRENQKISFESILSVFQEKEEVIINC